MKRWKTLLFPQDLWVKEAKGKVIALSSTSAQAKLTELQNTFRITIPQWVYYYHQGTICRIDQYNHYNAEYYHPKQSSWVHPQKNDETHMLWFTTEHGGFPLTEECAKQMIAMIDQEAALG